MSIKMNEVVSTKIYEQLADIVDGNIEDYSLTLQEPNKKGEGYLSDMCFVSLKHKENGKQMDLIIKQAFPQESLRETHNIRNCYLNEIHFYAKVWPELRKFQEEKSLLKPFNKIPKCFSTTTENGNENLILENLRVQDFQMHDKKKPLDKKYYEFIFKQYGRYHATSFAYKIQHPQEYSELLNGLINDFSVFTEKKLFSQFLKGICDLALKNFDPQEDAKVINKFKEFGENAPGKFKEATIYKGDYSTIVHGDCWSNNMMFKYNECKEPIDMRFLDFQFSNVGTPVSDLAYCLYSGGSKEIFDDLDYYLKVYHNSLSETLEEFGCDPRTVYPFEQLKKDWVPYCRMGFLMGLMVWRAKTTYESDVMDFKDMHDRGEDVKLTPPRYDEDLYKKVSRDLILHMYENDFL